MNVLDLFSGIGGFSLGLERAGMRTVAFCEINEYCRAVLRKHWPDVPCYTDVTKLCRRVYDCEPENDDGEVICPRCSIEFGDCECIGTDQFIDEVGAIDVICGGFPCQPFSVCGNQLGFKDDRSLWPEYLRVIKELWPAWVIGENVTGIVGMELDNVLADLEGSGYSCGTFDLPACAVGARHKRSRIFFVAHDDSERLEGVRPKPIPRVKSLQGDEDGRGIASEIFRPDLHTPKFCGKSDGVPFVVDRIKALGNSVVPQIPELIGRMIMECEK